jgi:DNA/RNA-binding domain of Phe-tRNA-synthetase-like protein
MHLCNSELRLNLEQSKPFLVSKDCLELGLRSGAVIFRGLGVAPADAELRRMIDVEFEELQRDFPNVAELRATSEVTKYREILKSVGVKPRKQPPSVESLFQFGLKRGGLPSINNLVDTYNLISVRTRCSMGAHDLERITLPVELRLLRGDESFTPLGSRGPQEVRAGEFGYVDADNRLLCRLDVLQADFSKVTTSSRNVLVIIEGTADHAPGAMQRIFDETVKRVRDACGGEAEVVAMPK